MQNKKVSVRSSVPVTRAKCNPCKRRRAQWRSRPREMAKNLAGGAATVDPRTCLLDLPDEILAGIVRWALSSSSEPAALIEAVTSLRGCCTRLDALCRAPLFRPADADPRLVPFARCDADAYNPASVPRDGCLVSAAGLARAPRLRRPFVQTCVRYAIYSLIVTKPGTCVCAKGLDLVSFSSFARQRPPFSLMIHALTRGAYAPDHIEVYEYSDGHTVVRVDAKVAAGVCGDKPCALDERTQSTINDALVVAAVHAMTTTDSTPHERTIVADSIDLFEAYPDVIEWFLSTRPDFCCGAGRARALTRHATLDISSIVYPACWDAVYQRARRSREPLTDFSFLCNK